MVLQEHVEEIFGFRGRVRILTFLAEQGEMYITQLRRATGLCYEDVEMHLDALKEFDLVEKKDNNMRFYSLKFRQLILYATRGSGINLEINY